MKPYIKPWTKQYRLIICSECFTEEENKRLKLILTSTFGFKSVTLQNAETLGNPSAKRLYVAAEDARKFTANAPKYFPISFLYKLNGNLYTSTFKDLNNNLNLAIHNNQDVTFKLTTGETYCCICEQLYRQIHEKRLCFPILCLDCGNFFIRRHNCKIKNK